MSDGLKPTVRQVFDEHARYIWRTLRHLGVSDADTPDLCQEVFVTVHDRLPSFEGRSSLRTWLYGICIRGASEPRRRAYVRRERPESDPTPDEAGLTEGGADTHFEQRSAVE